MLQQKCVPPDEHTRFSSQSLKIMIVTVCKHWLYSQTD